MVETSDLVLCERTHILRRQRWTPGRWEVIESSRIHERKHIYGSHKLDSRELKTDDANAFVFLFCISLSVLSCLYKTVSVHLTCDETSCQNTARSGLQLGTALLQTGRPVFLEQGAQLNMETKIFGVLPKQWAV